MQIIIFFILLLLSILGIIYGRSHQHGEMTMISFAILFLLGMTITGAGGLFGGEGGIVYPTGQNETYSYVTNSSLIDTIAVVDTNTTYSNWFYGAFMAIAAFFGFLGQVLGKEGGWTK